jgi:hypothetical protein
VLLSVISLLYSKTKIAVSNIVFPLDLHYSSLMVIFMLINLNADNSVSQSRSSK